MMSEPGLGLGEGGRRYGNNSSKRTEPVTATKGGAAPTQQQAVQFRVRRYIDLRASRAATHS